MSHILLDKAGERAIIMAPASTGEITGDVFEKHFKSALEFSRIVSRNKFLEISIFVSGIYRNF